MILREPLAETREIAEFGWEVTKEEAVRQCLHQMFLISLAAIALKAYKLRNCSCHGASHGLVLCCNPFTIYGDKEHEEAEGNERDNED